MSAKKKKKEEKAQSDQIPGQVHGVVNAKRCFSTAGSVQAIAGHGNRQQKTGLPEGSTAAEHFGS